MEQSPAVKEIENLMRQQKWEAAALACVQELDLHPTAARVHGYLGMSQFRLSRFSDAIVSFRRAIALDPSFWEAGAKLAQCLTQTRQYEEAYKEVSYWLPKQPNDHTLQGLAEFLKPMVHGETQRWEQTMNLERKIILPNK